MIQVPFQTLTSRCPLNSNGSNYYWSLRIPLKEQVRVNDKFHVVQPGDTLPALAHRYYGDVQLWWALYDTNISKLLCHPLLMPMGTTLTVPDKDVLESELLNDRQI